MLRVLLVDDHILLRSGVIKTLLNIFPQRFRFHEASTGQEALELLHRFRFNLLLLDLSLPDNTGFGLLKNIRSSASNLPIVVLSSHPAEQYAERALRAGASAYVNKGIGTIELKETIERVLGDQKKGKNKRTCLPEDTIADGMGSEDITTILSPREFQMVCMMGSGFTITEIAKELDLRISSVSTYKSRVLDKLKLRTTGDLIKYCVENRIFV